MSSDMGCVHTWEHKGGTFRCGYPTIPASSFCGLHSLAPVAAGTPPEDEADK